MVRADAAEAKAKLRAHLDASRQEPGRQPDEEGSGTGASRRNAAKAKKEAAAALQRGEAAGPAGG